MRIRRFWQVTVIVSLMAVSVMWLGTPDPVAAACAQALPTDKGQAAYSFNVASAGTYRVWARLYPTQANNNGIYIQIDDVLCRTVLGHNNAIPANQLTWVDYGNTTTSKVNVTLSAGSHQLTVAGYDPSVGLDKILLLADTTCTPTGDGSNCAVAATPTPTTTSTPGGGGTTPKPSTTPVGTPAPTPTPVTIGSGSQPVPVSGKIQLSPVSSSGGTVTYKVNGQTVSGNTIDTTKLPDGLNIIESVVTNPDGTKTIKTQTIKVENGWQYKLMRAAQDHPEWLGAILGLIGLIIALLFGIFGPKPYVRYMWDHIFFGRKNAAIMTGPSIIPGVPSITGPKPSQVVYPTHSDNDQPK